MHYKCMYLKPSLVRNILAQFLAMLSKFCFETDYHTVHYSIDLYRLCTKLIWFISVGKKQFACKFSRSWKLPRKAWVIRNGIGKIYTFNSINVLKHLYFKSFLSKWYGLFFGHEELPWFLCLNFKHLLTEGLTFFHNDNWQN